MRAKLTREEHRIADGIAEHGLYFDRDFMLEDGNADLFFLYYFPREFYSAVLERPHFEDMNYRVINVLENERRCVIQLPGGHGKTCTVRHWIPYVFCREPNVSMMYVEKSEPIAQAAARNIMNMLVTNERLIEDFGSFRGDFWSAQRFTIRQRTESISTPSLVVYGAGSKGTLGTRANIIIVDDPVTEEHAVSELERERLWAWWSQAATTVPYPLPLSKHDRYLNKLFLIGTSFHLDDLYHRVVQQGGFDHLLMRAVDEATGECLSHRFCWEDEKALVERAKADESAASLLKMIRDGRIINLKAFRDEQGSIAFYRRYQNEPFDPSKQVFNRLWLIGGHDVLSPSTGYPGCLDETSSFGEDKQDGWVYWTGVDPSSGGSTAKWAANFACVTLGYNPNDPQKLIHLVDMDYGDYPLLSDNPSRTTQADIVLDHVRRYNSRLVVETNAQQHAHVSVYRSEARKKNVTLLITGHYCVDDETEALSKQGWVSFDKLQPGDEILTLNMSTGLSEWKPVTDIYVSEYTGSMTLISGATINACCTPDHSWPVKALYAPKRKLRGAIRLKETVDVNTSDWVVLSAESAYDPEPLYDDDFVVLVGWAITEGSYREVGKSIRIGQSESANPEYCKEIRSLLVRCNAQFSERDNGSGTTVFAVNGGMGAKIRSVTENGKNLPAEFVLSLSSKQRNLLIETMVKADGWSQGKTMYLCSDSGSILTGFEMLCALEGSSTYRRYRKDDPGHGVVSKRSISQAMLAKLPQATSEKWSGTIWCPSTENGTFLAKRGGITYFTGNTSQNKKINFKDGVPAIAPYFENGQVQIPYRRPEDKRRAQQFIEEAVNYPLYATDDCLMAFWMAWMRIDSALKQNRQSVITKVERPAYFNRRQAEINFPPHWTSKQREAYLLGNSPEELEEAEEVMAV